MIPCLFWNSAACFFGEACRYSHAGRPLLVRVRELEAEVAVLRDIVMSRPPVVPPFPPPPISSPSPVFPGPCTVSPALSGPSTSTSVPVPPSTTAPYIVSPTLSAPSIAHPAPAPSQSADVSPEAFGDGALVDPQCGVVIEEGVVNGEGDNGDRAEEMATDPTASTSPSTWAEQVKLTRLKLRQSSRPHKPTPRFQIYKLGNRQSNS